MEFKLVRFTGRQNGLAWAFKAVFIFICGGFLWLQALPPAKAEDQTIARVGEVSISQAELDFALEDLASQFGQLPKDKRRVAVLAALIDIKLMAKAASAAGMENSARHRARLAFLTARVLHNQYFEEKIASQISEDELRQRYDTEIADLPNEREYRARHILVKEEATAKELIGKLQKGEDFVELAKTHSTSPSGPNGGDLDYFSDGQMVPEFEKAVKALEIGAVSAEPVKTQFGWHIIKKEDERDRPKPEFDDVKEQIRQLVLRDKYVAGVEAMRKANQIEILDADLKKQYEQNQRKK